LDFENLSQIADCLIPAERQQRDFLPGIIRRGKERKALNVVPVKVRERDDDLVLLMADGAKVSARFRNPVPASMITIRFVSVNVIFRHVVLPPNC